MLTQLLWARNARQLLVFQNVAQTFSPDAMQVDPAEGGAHHVSTAGASAPTTTAVSTIINPFATMKFKAEDHGFSVQPRKLTSTGIPIVGSAASGSVGHADAAVSLQGHVTPDHLRYIGIRSTT